MRTRITGSISGSFHQTNRGSCRSHGFRFSAHGVSGLLIARAQPQPTKNTYLIAFKFQKKAFYSDKEKGVPETYLRERLSIKKKEIIYAIGVTPFFRIIFPYLAVSPEMTTA